MSTDHVATPALTNAISLAAQAIPRAMERHRETDPTEYHVKRLSVSVPIWVLEELLATARRIPPPRPAPSVTAGPVDQSYVRLTVIVDDGTRTHTWHAPLVRDFGVETRPEVDPDHIRFAPLRGFEPDRPQVVSFSGVPVREPGADHLYTVTIVPPLDAGDA